MQNSAKSTVQHDNERTRVTLWEFTPNAATGWHIHGMDYVIVPLKTGKLKLIDAEGNESKVELGTGIFHFRKSGVAHDVINCNGYDFPSWKWNLSK